MSQLGVDTAQCRRHGLPADGFAVAIELEQLGAGIAAPAFQPIQTLPTGLSGLPPPGPAMPVTATAMPAPELTSAPDTISSTVRG